MAYSVSNKPAKKFCNRTVLVQLIVEDMFLSGHSVEWLVYQGVKKV